jgi:hypothetical protein
METSRPTDDANALHDAQVEAVKQSRSLPPADQVIWRVLAELFFNLRTCSLAEDQWGTKVADKYTRGAIAKAAQERAQAEGRSVTPVEDMTMEEALDLLSEPYSSNFGR